MHTLGGDCAMHSFSPIIISYDGIILELSLMLFSTYYAQNYTGIIGTGLTQTHTYTLTQTDIMLTHTCIPQIRK